MTSRDFALDIEPGADAARIDQIERVLHRYAAEVLVIAAMKIDDADRQGRIQFISGASSICRDEGAQHLNLT